MVRNLFSNPWFNNFSSKFTSIKHSISFSQYNECSGNSFEITVYMLIFFNTIISACCGCFNDYLSKATNASLHALNIWLYSFGFLFNLSYYFLLRFQNPNEPAFFDGYKGWGLMIVFTNSIIGLAITAVYKVSTNFSAYSLTLIVWRRDCKVHCSISINFHFAFLIISLLWYSHTNSDSNWLPYNLFGLYINQCKSSKRD